MMTGRRWGEGVTCRGPRERKNVPTWSMRWIFVGSLDGLVTIGKGHDVPTHSPTREVVERGEEAGDVVGMVLTDGKRGGKANPGGGHGHPGEQRHRVMHRGLGGVAQCHVRGVLIRLKDIVKIGEEDHIELAAFAHLGNVLVEFGPPPVVAAVRTRMAPHGQAMVGGAMHQILCQVHVFGHMTPLRASVSAMAYREVSKNPASW